MIEEQAQDWQRIKEMQGELEAYVQNPSAFSTAIEGTIRALKRVQFKLHGKIEKRKAWMKLEDDQLDYPTMKKDAEIEVALLKFVCGCPDCKQ